MPMIYMPQEIYDAVQAVKHSCQSHEPVRVNWPVWDRAKTFEWLSLQPVVTIDHEQQDAHSDVTAATGDMS